MPYIMPYHDHRSEPQQLAAFDSDHCRFAADGALKAHNCFGHADAGRSRVALRPLERQCGRLLGGRRSGIAIVSGRAVRSQLRQRLVAEAMTRPDGGSGRMQSCANARAAAVMLFEAALHSGGSLTVAANLAPYAMSSRGIPANAIEAVTS
jgi:hypothetical protein